MRLRLSELHSLYCMMFFASKSQIFSFYPLDKRQILTYNRKNNLLRQLYE